MKLKFWGVRGSTPTPERRNSHYGGNTPCLELRLANGTILIFDCGSGLRALGKSLMRQYPGSPIVAYIFMSHFHWDHIQGIPFFTPLYRKGNAFFFHSVALAAQDVQHAVEGQMVSPYFPVDMSVMSAVRHFYDIGTEPIDINGAIIRSIPLNHPQGCAAYRIEADGGSLVYATDTEPGSPMHDESLREFARGADVFICDSQYTPEELHGEKKGWGHSAWTEAVQTARDAAVKQLVLFHHDPDRDDAALDALLASAKGEFANTIAAAEGLTLEIPQVQPSKPADRRYDAATAPGTPRKKPKKRKVAETFKSPRGGRKKTKSKKL